jgi:hypothetical protein
MYIVSFFVALYSQVNLNIVNAPWYVSNATLHTDLGMQYVQDVIQKKNASSTTPH